MAYMTQENKKMLAPQIKAVLKKYKMKGSISVRNMSTLQVTLKEGELDFGDKPRNVNTYWIEDNYEGEVNKFLNELKDAMNGVGSVGEQNFDKSDIQSDYFHVGWYIDINVGKWDKPYVCNADIKFKPDWVSPPGDTILDIMDEKEWDEVEVAKRLKMDIKQLNELIKGDLAITYDIANKLTCVLGASVVFWQNREQYYRADIAALNKLMKKANK